MESNGEYKLEQSVSVRAVPELIVGEAGRQANSMAKHRPRLVYQWPDNVKMYKYICKQNSTKIYPAIQE